MPRAPLLELDAFGLYCAAGDFYVDPWAGPVERAVLTHAHADHAQPVMRRALAAAPGAKLAELRLPGVELSTAAYGERVRMGDAMVSLHPSGHMLGAAQVRVEHRGEIWVVSGDYKLAPDPTTLPFQSVRCHVFITEATFGLPLFRWNAPREIFDDIHAWWANAKAEGRPALMHAYAMGKSARVLAALDTTLGPVFTHGAVENVLEAYRASGVRLPDTTHLAALGKQPLPAGALVLAPPSAQNTPWARKLEQKNAATAFCSGWMRVRGFRRRRGLERGFVLSDHADYPALEHAVKESGADRILVTHGSAAPFARALREAGLDAEVLRTPYAGENEGDGEPAEAAHA